MSIVMANQPPPPSIPPPNSRPYQGLITVTIGFPQQGLIKSLFLKGARYMGVG